MNCRAQGLAFALRSTPCLPAPRPEGGKPPQRKAAGRSAGRTAEYRFLCGGQAASAVFALLFSVYLLTFSGIYHSSDEMSMLVATDSLARRGVWDIDLIRWMGEQQGSFGPDGHLYSRKGIGTTLAALPLYWLATRSTQVGNVQAAMLTNGLATALTGALIYLTLRRLAYRDSVALGTSLAYGLATMAWPYARYLFSETLAALGLMLCAYALVRYGTPWPRPFRGEQGFKRRDWASLLLAGVGLGVAILARLNNAIVAPFLGLLLLAYLYRRYRGDMRSWMGPVVLFLLPLLGALAISAWYNWLRFGNPLTTGYLPEERFATPFFEGLYGLTFGPGKGLFWYNPILFAALAAWPAFFRRHRAEALVVAAVVLSTVAFYAPWYLWWAGHSWGPRFLVTTLPFAALPLAAALEAAARRRVLRSTASAVAAGLGIVGVVSIAVQILGVAVDFNVYLEEIYARLGLYHPSTLFDPLYSPLLRQWAYLHPRGLDLAWARGGALNWAALAVGVLLVTLSALAMGTAGRRRLSIWAQAGLLGVLALGALGSLLLYAPDGDTAEAAQVLAAMEHPGEAAALTDPLLTQPFQDAYDGHLAVWGVPSRDDLGAEPEAVWTIGAGTVPERSGAGTSERAAARFQVGDVRLDGHLPAGKTFEDARIPAAARRDEARLGDVAKLIAAQVDGSPQSKARRSVPTTAERARQEWDGSAIRRGDALPLTLYWRALVPAQRSYTVFLQVINSAGVKAGQIDRLPCDGGCSTTTWRPGDLIGEWYELPIQPDAPPGEYQLIAGMYDLATAERLPWLDAQGNPLGDNLTIGSVRVVR